jgi:uncharacterized protein involved in exopolysaccharide biosynthesis
MLLFYFAYFYKHEAFDNNTSAEIQAIVDTLTSELKSQNSTGAQSESVRNLLTKLDDLNTRVQALINLNRDSSTVALSQANTQTSSSNPMNDTVSTLLSQDNKIAQLQNRLAQLQQIYSSYLQRRTTQEETYDKIPVYSSCIVSEANGQYTTTTPP